jgi:WhiB family redox-sensing transcriptional regulator
MSAIETRLLWIDRAACRGEAAHLFFSPPVLEASDVRAKREKVAKSICARCPVTSECLSYALQVNETLGIWGGHTEVERRHLALTTST